MDRQGTHAVDAAITNTVNSQIVEFTPFDRLRGQGAASGSGPPVALAFVGPLA